MWEVVPVLRRIVCGDCDRLGRISTVKSWNPTYSKGDVVVQLHCDTKSSCTERELTTGRWRAHLGPTNRWGTPQGSFSLENFQPSIVPRKRSSLHHEDEFTTTACSNPGFVSTGNMEERVTTKEVRELIDTLKGNHHSLNHTHRIHQGRTAGS